MSDHPEFVLASASNTIVPAYLAIQQKGYSIRRVETPNSGSDELWFAEDTECRFVAEDPLTLLALVALHETRGKEWQATDEQITEFVAQYECE